MLVPPLKAQPQYLCRVCSTAWAKTPSSCESWSQSVPPTTNLHKISRDTFRKPTELQELKQVLDVFYRVKAKRRAGGLRGSGIDPFCRALKTTKSKDPRLAKVFSKLKDKCSLSAWLREYQSNFSGNHQVGHQNTLFRGQRN